MAWILPSEMAKDIDCCFTCERVLEHRMNFHLLYGWSEISKQSICFCYFEGLLPYYLKNSFTNFFFQVVTDILHLHGKQLNTYRGNYDTFERTREEQIKNKQKAVEAHERARSHMQVLVFIFYLTNAIYLEWFVYSSFWWNLDFSSLKYVAVIYWQVPV